MKDKNIMKHTIEKQIAFLDGKKHVYQVLMNDIEFKREHPNKEQLIEIIDGILKEIDIRQGIIYDLNANQK